MADNHLSLTYEVDLGVPGVDHDPTHPLSRAMDDAIQGGRLPGRLTNCFFAYHAAEGQSHLRWLGVFGCTPTGRVLFFPGYFLRLLNYAHGKSQQRVNAFDIDHITLEPGLKKWHLTGARGRRQGGMTTRNLGGGCLLWFGMSVTRPDVLRAVKRETRIEATVPSSDVDRRSTALLDAVRGAHDFIVMLPPHLGQNIENGFLHFAVLVGAEQFDSYMGAELALPKGSPMASALNVGSTFPVRIHRSQLADGIFLQVTCSFVPGVLARPVIFSW